MPNAQQPAAAPEALGEVQRTTGSRLGFLDWSRGLAALIMLQGHVFHSFTSTSLRDGGPYVLSQFIGGITPAVFLFLTGLTLAFLMDGQERKGILPADRIKAALRRAGYLAVVALAFRFQLWLFAWGQSPWTDLFKVDILNSMAVAVALFAVMAVFQTVQRIRLCAALGLFVAVASPLVSQLDWTGVSPMLRAYIVPDANHFSFFPWAAFVAFGMSAGSVIRVLTADKLEKAVQWGGLLGFGLILGGQYFSNLPYSIYAKSDFWVDSPALTLIKTGIILLILGFAFVWDKQFSAGEWSWIRQLGTTSLLVYWVHIELVYGRWFGAYKETLSVTHTVLASVVLIAAMVGLSVVRTRWSDISAYGRRLLSAPRMSED